MKANNEHDNDINAVNVTEVKLMYMTEIKSSNRIQIRTSEDAAGIFFNHWDFHTIEHIEEVKMLLLNRANKLLGVVNLSKGGSCGSIIDIKVVLQYAIKANAHAVILAHNHPSGNLEASEADKRITERLREALKLVSCQL